MKKHLDILIEKELLKINNHELRESLHTIFSQQHFKGRLANRYVSHLCNKFELTPQQLAEIMLPLATAYSTPGISHFKVGAIIIGESGSFYFGANQEYANCAIQQTVHAEQSGISHAWIEGEKSIKELFVNYTPCGHCRQFMNELNSATELKIHLPEQATHDLAYYLPNSFGPKDLGIDKVLFDHQQHHLSSPDSDALTQAATAAANMSHAPYSESYSGVAIETIDGKVFIGSYAENAAFNPSLPPMQVALNSLKLSGYEYQNIKRAVLIEYAVNVSQRAIAQAALSSVNDSCQFISYNLAQQS